ncbi:D-glycero-beta-D-manno-heptose-7-phosphate kinase [Candidatus Woesearchaeota archaeon]|nr:D-glycero-beta-D-manno-heptose-7-phosphate kinase [Candidatus Woesearchaeota archaeon]
MKELKDFINSFSKKKVCVIGDLMLDKYIYGTVNRISPEAPVPVLRVVKEDLVPGGAANVANNLKALGAEPHLVGLVGNDSAGTEWLELMKSCGIQTEYIIESKDLRTIQKIRIVGHNQQITRVDYEDTADLSSKINILLNEKIKLAVQNSDVVIISDYGKGIINPTTMPFIKTECKKLGIKIFVDPKPNNKELYKDTYLITPNIKEATELSKIEYSDKESLIKIGNNLITSLGTNLIITKSEEGMSVFERDREHIEIPTKAVEVFDVSGAGDTVISLIALSISSGASLRDSAIIANIGAGIVVGKKGTSTLTVRELISRLDESSSKVKSIEEIKTISESVRSKNKKIVWTNGYFDPMHSGHIYFLKKAKEKADVLVLGLNSDNSIEKALGQGHPFLDQSQRAELLSSLEAVDYIVFYDEQDASKYIDAIQPDIYAKGEDYDENKINDKEREILDKHNTQLIIIKHSENIKNLIKNTNKNALI